MTSPSPGCTLEGPYDVGLSWGPVHNGPLASVPEADARLQVVDERALDSQLHS